MKTGTMTPTGTMPSATVTENLRHQGCPVQVRWDFKEEQQELEDGEKQTVWTFNFDNMVEKWNRFRTYMKDELCWLGNGKVYVSEIDDNNNKPPQAGWKEIVFEGVQKAEEQEAVEWVQPTGAHDVYGLGELVVKDGKKYMSNHPNNSWEPGTLEYLNLWIEVGEEDTVEDYPVWVQPTGAHDAYQTGDIVYYPTENDELWISKIDANTTVPDGDEPYNRYWEPYEE
jgi:hypothetical protein